MSEIRINSYNEVLLRAWEANIDVQFIHNDLLPEDDNEKENEDEIQENDSLEDLVLEKEYPMKDCCVLKLRSYVMCGTINKKTQRIITEHAFSPQEKRER